MIIEIRWNASVAASRERERERGYTEAWEEDRFS